MTRPDRDQPAPPPAAAAPGTGDPAAGTPGAPREEAVDVSRLSPEEQMARFEQELKEKDWGHQPC
ncbi:MAG: hypothetical protein JNG83_04705 [Opitutaceae bacterium]|nr:hypothetical protein [Opitutaceae bacterium]